MRDIIIKKEFEKAKSGDKDAKALLFKHYYKAYSELFELNKGIPNIKEEYARIINESIDKYFVSLPKIDLSAYITTQLYTYIKNYNGRRNLKRKESEEIGDLLKVAKSSDESRKLLIEKCMYLIDEYLISAQFDSNFTKEDARQAGYLFLTEKINNYFDAGLKVPLSVYLLVAFDQIYLNFLREKKEEVEEYHEKVTLAGLYLNKDTFEEENIEFEYCDFIDNTLEKEDIKEIFKSLTDSKEIRISKEQGISRQAVNKKIHKNKEKVKSFFDMK